jgi:hypothetical protein
MSDGKSNSPEWVWRATTAFHLTGAAAFGLVSYWDRVGIYGPMFRVLVAWGLLSLFLCPFIVFGLVASRRLTGWQAPAAIAVACTVEVTQMLAMVPLFQ